MKQKYERTQNSEPRQIRINQHLGALFWKHEMSYIILSWRNRPLTVGTSSWKLTHRPAWLKHCGTQLTTVTDVHHIIISVSRPLFPSSPNLHHYRADRGWVEIATKGASDPELSGPSVVGRAGLQKPAYVPCIIPHLFFYFDAFISSNDSLQFSTAPATWSSSAPHNQCNPHIARLQKSRSALYLLGGFDVLSFIRLAVCD